MKSGGHEVIDLGDDPYTRGRPHPMIDPSLRAERIPAVFEERENAVLLLDVVLGHGSDPDPAGASRPSSRTASPGSVPGAGTSPSWRRCAARRATPNA